MSTLVYIRELAPPYLTCDFQRDTCERWLSVKQFTDFQFTDALPKDEKYERLVIYSVAVLGDTLEEIIKTIKQLTDNGVKIYTVTDPIDFQNFGTDPQQNMLLSTCIGYALYQNKVWKELL